MVVKCPECGTDIKEDPKNLPLVFQQLEGGEYALLCATCVRKWKESLPHAYDAQYCQTCGEIATAEFENPTQHIHLRVCARCAGVIAKIAENTHKAYDKFREGKFNAQQ